MPSTVIAHMEYLPDAETLRITFVSGKVYDYLGVPPAIYEAMKTSGAKGVYFNQHVKNNFTCKPVTA